LSVEGVKGTHKLRTRKIGHVIALDVHVLMDDSLSLFEAHEISDRVERCLREAFGNGTYVNLHMEPLSYYEKPGTRTEKQAAGTAKGGRESDAPLDFFP